MRSGLAIAAALAALAIGGCTDDGDQNEQDAVRSVVEKFALADGPDACDYLGGQALEDNYGGRDYATGKKRCEEASDRFEGERIRINRVRVTSDTTARVDAEQDGRLYVVSLSKPQDDWVIERIIQQRRE